MSVLSALCYEYRYNTVAWFLVQHNAVVGTTVLCKVPEITVVSRGYQVLVRDCYCTSFSLLCSSHYCWETGSGTTLSNYSTLDGAQLLLSRQVFLAWQFCLSHMQNLVNSRGAHSWECSRVSPLECPLLEQQQLHWWEWCNCSCQCKIGFVLAPTICSLCCSPSSYSENGSPFFLFHGNFLGCKLPFGGFNRTRKTRSNSRSDGQTEEMKTATKAAIR